MKVTVLGCGGSGGVPLIGNIWGACNPHNPKNRRLRVSILVQEGDTTLLVDCGPDLRQQMLTAQIGQIDAVLMTHAHADHSSGIDDLRRFYWLNGNVPIPYYADQMTMDEMHKRFDYAFKPFSYGADNKPPFTTHTIKPGDKLKFRDIEVTVFEQEHLRVKSMGFRFNNFAYTTDAKMLDDAAFDALTGITHWIVDCERYEEHKAHSHFEQTLGWIERVAPQRAWLTHMGIHLDYDELLAKCPPGIEPAYDGLVIEI